MKIKKTLFSTELEFTPEEVRDFPVMPTSAHVGLLFWIKQNFGLDMLPKILKKDKK
jgi:hypothetical protein